MTISAYTLVVFVCFETKSQVNVALAGRLGTQYVDQATLELTDSCLPECTCSLHILFRQELK